MTEKTMHEKSIFSALNKIDVNDKTEKKGKFRYLSWTYAWEELQKICPDAIYEIVKFDGLPYKENTRGECIVFTKLTINRITHEMWLPVMDNCNKAMKNPDMMAINKAIMRCLVKNIAMFGLGLYIYAGEDLPEEVQSEISQQQKPVEKKQEPQKPVENANRKITNQERDELQKLIADADKDIVKLCEYYKVQALSELTYIQFRSAKATCEKTINDMN